MTAIPRSSAEFYKKATAFWNYPEVPYGPALRGMIRPTDVVADIGCGIGIVSRYLAGLCRRVIAIDRDETALDVLRAELSGEDCGNIEVVHACWPQVQTDDWDVAVAFYHHHFGYTGEEIETLLRKTRRGGIIVNPGIRQREGFCEDLGPEFGITNLQKSCAGGCYVRGRLEQAGFDVTCEEISHDFGQPVDSKEEAVEYAMRQLRLEEHQRPKLEERIMFHAEEVDGQLVLPIKRFNCLLRFTR